MLSLIERSKKVLDVKCWSGAIVEDISGFLKNTNKDILMTKLNVYESKYLKSISIYLPLQIANKEKKSKDMLQHSSPLVKYQGVLIYKLALPVLLFQGV